MPISPPDPIVTVHRFLVAGWLLFCLAPAGTPAAAAGAGAAGSVRLAQAAQPAQAPATAAPAASADAQAEEPIGNVATLIGSATVTRNDTVTPLKPKDDIYLNDVLQTAAKSSLGITFIDATTFNLTANAKITVDNFVYEEGGKQNAALVDVAKGTVAFVAASVAKTGDMKISTPSATLGIRGTTGVVEVPEGAAANSPNNVAIKLYPDADGKVGRIEVNDRAGARLGFLTQGASGFTIRPGVGGARFAAVPLIIPPQQIQRDRGFVRQVHSTQNLGRRVVTEQRDFRRANPGFVNPNRPIRSGPPGQQNQNGQQRPNNPQNPPGPQRQNNLQNPPGPQQPGRPNRQGLNPQGQRAGAPGQQGAPNVPGAPPRPGQPQQPAVQGQPAARNAPGVPPRPGQAQQPAVQGQPGAPNTPGVSPRPGRPQQPAVQGQPGAPNTPSVPPRQPGVQAPPGSQTPPGAMPRSNPQQPNLQPPPGVRQGQPGMLRPGLQNRPALLRRPAPAPAKRGRHQVR